MSNLKHKTLYLLLLLLVFYSCKEDEIASEYPSIRTLPVSGISPEGAVFHGEVVLPGRQEVLENGFIWHEGTNPLLEVSERKIFEKPVSSGRFSLAIRTALKPDTRYYVKAYARTKDYLIYGQEQSFVSMGSKGPEIFSIQPESAVWGDTVLIKGTRFSYQPKNNVVRFGKVEAQVISASDSLIITTVPLEENVGKVAVSVTISGNTATGSQEFTYLKPTISGFSPAEGTFNDTLEIRGTNLDRDKTLQIKLGTALAIPISISPNAIRVKVPASLKSSKTEISLISGLSGYKTTSNQSFLLLPPVLTHFSPDTATKPEQVISINGKNFNPISENNAVKIGGYNALVLQASATNLQVQLPDEIIPNKEISVFSVEDISVLGGGKRETFREKLIIHWESKWTKLKNFPGLGRTGAVAFSINGKGYAGTGYTNHATTLKDWWEYDPLLDEWSRKQDFPGDAREYASGFVQNSSGFVGLGTDGGSYGRYFKNLYAYDPASGNWNKKEDFGGTARAGAIAFSHNGKTYLGTGVNGFSQSLDDLWIYDLNTDSWAEEIRFPSKPVAASGTTLNGQAYILDNGAIWKLVNNNWEKINTLYEGRFSGKNLSSLGQTLIAGLGYISGTYDSYGLYQYFPSTNEWKFYAFPGNSRSGESLFVIGEQVYILFGTESNYTTTYTREAWRFNPSKSD